MDSIRIAPSILAADFSKLGEEISAVSDAGADFIHIDVMDGHFVPNLTIGPGVVKDLRKTTKLPFDVHLMISPVDPFITEFINAGAEILSVHPESGPHLHRTLQTIRAAGAKAGIALNPATPLSVVEPVLGDIDLVLVMSVNPGFGGQKFISSQLKKIAMLRAMIDKAGLEIEIEVDGGVDKTTARDVVSAGATILVAGSAVFRGGPEKYADNIRALRDAGR